MEKKSEPITYDRIDNPPKISEVGFERLVDSAITLIALSCPLKYSLPATGEANAITPRNGSNSATPIMLRTIPVKAHLSTLLPARNPYKARNPKSKKTELTIPARLTKAT
jgi:hypothetical protein